MQDAHASAAARTIGGNRRDCRMRGRWRPLPRLCNGAIDQAGVSTTLRQSSSFWSKILYPSAA